MSIVTKQGDGGKTRLFSGETVSKNNPRTEAYGTLDEVVATMGMARSLCKKTEIGSHILETQKMLFRLGTELATKGKTKVKLEPIGKSDVGQIEYLIGEYEAAIKLPKTFAIPGENTASSAIDISRAQCRRLERLMVGLFEAGEWKNPDALVFINRLSDLLFLMARREESK